MQNSVPLLTVDHGCIEQCRAATAIKRSPAVLWTMPHAAGEHRGCRLFTAARSPCLRALLRHLGSEH